MQTGADSWRYFPGIPQKLPAIRNHTIEWAVIRLAAARRYLTRSLVEAGMAMAPRSPLHATCEHHMLSESELTLDDHPVPRLAASRTGAYAPPHKGYTLDISHVPS